MRLAAVSLLLLSAVSGFAQTGTSRTELERRRQNILETIQATQAELAATKQDKKATMGQLHALQAKLSARQRLIGEINGEIGRLDGTIQSSSQEINRLQSNLQQLKLRYAQSVRYAYRHRSTQSMLAFLFSADDFNDGMRRMQYLKKYRDFRMGQAEKIQYAQTNIQQKIGVLNSEKSQKNLLLGAEEQQRLVLQNEANETNQVVKELKGRESELASEVAQNQKAARQLNKAIDNLIRREIELARKKAEEEARRRAEVERRKKEEEDRQRALAAAPKPGIGPSPQAGGGAYGNGKVNLATGSGAQPANSSNGGTVASSNGGRNNPPVLASATAAPSRPTKEPVLLTMTPEAAALSNGFANNRGRLPWPVDKGFVVSGFGVHKHPIAEKVMVENYGIDIQTGNGAQARAVFEGTVSSVLNMGNGQNVLISHGEYFTVYAGLSSVNVKRGDAVSTKQTIGTVGPNNEGDYILNFQVWKGTSKMNPAGWIAQ